MAAFQIGDRVEVVQIGSFYDIGATSRKLATVVAINEDGTIDARWDGLTDEQIAQYPCMAVYTYSPDRLQRIDEQPTEAAETVTTEPETPQASEHQAVTIERVCAECGANVTEQARQCQRCGSDDLIYSRQAVAVDGGAAPRYRATGQCNGFEYRIQSSANGYYVAICDDWYRTAPALTPEMARMAARVWLTSYGR